MKLDEIKRRKRNGDYKKVSEICGLSTDIVRDVISNRYRNEEKILKVLHAFAAVIKERDTKLKSVGIYA